MPDAGPTRQPFAGANKSGESLLSPLERRMAAAVVPRIPRFIETYHLTLASIVWCAGLVWFGSLAAHDLRWLHASSAMIVLQYLTDFFDGKLGKHRGTGLVKWGFYVDHVLDYAFLCALVIGYAFILPERSQFHLMLLLAAYTGHMVHAFLALPVTDRFRISHGRFGPTEFRIALIVINTLLARYGTHAMEASLPWVALGAAIVLGAQVFLLQRALWREELRR